MPQMMVSTGRALIPTGSYAEKVRGTGSFAHWPLWEASGTVAQCLVNPAQNGTASSDVSTWPVGTGIGDGNTAPIFDGVNDYVDILTVALQAAFNATEGTMMIWNQVANVGVWGDALDRFSVSMLDATDFNEFVWSYKLAAGNRYRWRYRAGGVDAIRDNFAMTTLVWFQTVLTWSSAANQVIAYLNGVQEGAIMAYPGVWAGNITVALIGAQTIGPITTPWHGGLAHCALWDFPLPPSVVADLAVVQ